MEYKSFKSSLLLSILFIVSILCQTHYRVSLYADAEEQNDLHSFCDATHNHEECQKAMATTTETETSNTNVPVTSIKSNTEYEEECQCLPFHSTQDST